MTAPEQYTLKTTEKVIIRTACPDDAQTILEHARVILAEDLYNIRKLEEFKMTVESEREWIQRHIEEQGRIILVAESAGTIVGLLGFENSSRMRLVHRGTLHMGVRPEHGRKGVGTALPQSLIQWARENPVIEKLRLSLFATNQTAIRLYMKMGFIHEGCRIEEVELAQG
jgi:RimJ/RimL family protein N-acetyltransferase